MISKALQTNLKMSIET